MILPTLGPIPNWDSNGLLPPIDEERPTLPPRSPYNVSLLDIVERFGSTRARRRLLMGLLDFRFELHGVGLVQGFQWIDGSFAENVEAMKGQDPDDIDLVTFFRVPGQYRNESGAQLLSPLLDRERIERDHKVDHYYVPLSGRPPEVIATESAYWYSVFAHRKVDYQWKGYLQIDLADNSDAEARAELERMECLGGLR